MSGAVTQLKSPGFSPPNCKNKNRNRKAHLFRGTRAIDFIFPTQVMHNAFNWGTQGATRLSLSRFPRAKDLILLLSGVDSFFQDRVLLCCLGWPWTRDPSVTWIVRLGAHHCTCLAASCSGSALKFSQWVLWPVELRQVRLKHSYLFFFLRFQGGLWLNIVEHPCLMWAFY